jgi:hypothetical protein
MTVKLHIWPGIDRTSRIFGSAHAGLSFEHKSKQFYVTWFGSGNSKSSAVKGHVGLGFTQIEKDGQIWNRRRGSSGIDHFYLPGTETKLKRNVPAEFDRNIILETDFTSTTVSFEAELSQYEALGRPCDDAIPIPVENFFDSGKALTQGIDIDSIAKWWEAKMALPPNHPGRQYKLISKSQNCISTVIEGLVVGGMSTYNKLGRTALYYSERDLKTWVVGALVNINRINSLISNSVAVQEIKNQSVNITGLNDIPTLIAWKRLSASNVKLSAFARRKGPIKVLDKLIERYHISDLDKMQRKEIVIKIMNQAFVHMVTKPNSDRRDAVKVLAQISYNIAKKLTDEIDEDNMAQALASRPQGQLVGQRLSQLVVEEDMVVECSVDGED